MAARATSNEKLIKLIAEASQYSNIAEAARAIGTARSTLCSQIKLAKKRGLADPELFSENWEPGTHWKKSKGFTVDPLPPKSVPVEQRIELMINAFERRHQYEQAKRWRPVRVTMDGPIGIQWFGDPHVDDNGCNWPLLKRDVGIVQKTEGLFGANIGDTTNNWVGRLARLYANQDTSEETALDLANWLMNAVPWILIIRGNHDLWSGNQDLLKWMAQGAGVGPVVDWQAQVSLMFPNGNQARIWAAHSFPGTSQWNPLHGGVKRAAFSGEANLYIQGHHHDWGLYETEDPHRGTCYWVAKARGYKYIDSYASNLGYGAQQHGASITSIFDPEGSGPAFLRCFSDAEEAAAYLTWKRSRGRGKA